MVQVAHRARLRRRLAGRLARDVALLRRGRAGAEDRRPGALSLGAASAALSVSRARAERRRPRAGARVRGARDRLGADAARHTVGAARRRASVRLSRLLHRRLLDQRQAERADHLDPARARGRRGDPRPRDGRPDRGRERRARDRRALSSRGHVAVSAGAQRRRGRLRDRDAATAAELRLSAISRRSRQQLRPGRPQPDGALQPGRLRRDARRDPLVQGAALARDHRALELHRRRARTSTAATPT